MATRSSDVQRNQIEPFPNNQTVESNSPRSSAISSSSRTTHNKRFSSATPQDGVIRSSKRRYSTASVFSDQVGVSEALDESNSSWRTGCVSYAKILAVVVAPIVAVVAVFGIQINTSVVGQRTVLRTRDSVDTFVEVSHFIAGLQDERELSILVVTSPEVDHDAVELLAAGRRYTDSVLAATTPWPARLSLGDGKMTSKLDLTSLLLDIRKSVDERTVNYSTVLELYSKMTSSLMDWEEVSDNAL